MVNSCCHRSSASSAISRASTKQSKRVKKVMRSAAAASHKLSSARPRPLASRQPTKGDRPSPIGLQGIAALDGIQRDYKEPYPFPCGLLYVCHSEIPGVRFGVKCVRDVRRGELLELSPALMWPQRRYEPVLDDYTFLHENYSPKRNSSTRYNALLLGYGSLFNHSDYPNVGCWRINDDIYEFRALRDIPADSELFISYGKDYWEDRKHRNKQEVSLPELTDKNGAENSAPLESKLAIDPVEPPLNPNLLSSAARWNPSMYMVKELDSPKYQECTAILGKSELVEEPNRDPHVWVTWGNHPAPVEHPCAELKDYEQTVLEKPNPLLLGSMGLLLKKLPTFTWSAAEAPNEEMNQYWADRTREEKALLRQAIQLCREVDTSKLSRWMQANSSVLANMKEEAPAIPANFANFEDDFCIAIIAESETTQSVDGNPREKHHHLSSSNPERRFWCVFGNNASVQEHSVTSLDQRFRKRKDKFERFQTEKLHWLLRKLPRIQIPSDPPITEFVAPILLAWWNSFSPRQKADIHHATMCCKVKSAWTPSTLYDMGFTYEYPPIPWLIHKSR